MKQLQQRELMRNISGLYARDLGSVREALDAKLSNRRRDDAGVFADLPRKAQYSDLSISQQAELHNGLLLDWVHYKVRCVVPLYRTVTFAQSAAEVDPSHPAIADILDALSNGQSLKHRVSRMVMNVPKPKAIKADQLLWHWQIHHFHLGKLNRQTGLAEGTDELLFVYADQNSAVVLGLGCHGDFTSDWLLTNLLNARRDLLERWRVQGIVGLSGDHKVTDRKKRWRRANSIASVSGKFVFPPGQGVMASGHSFRLTRQVDDVLDAISGYDNSIVFGQRKVAPLSLRFNEVCLELYLGNECYWQGQPLV